MSFEVDCTQEIQEEEKQLFYVDVLIRVRKADGVYISKTISEVSLTETILINEENIEDLYNIVREVAQKAISTTSQKL